MEGASEILMHLFCSGYNRYFTWSLNGCNNMSMSAFVFSTVQR